LRSKRVNEKEREENNRRICSGRIELISREESKKMLKRKFSSR